MDLPMSHKPVLRGFVQNIRKIHFSNIWFYGVLAGFASLAGFIMVYDMEWGPWAFSDSAAYISAARNLVAGNGLSIPTPDGGLSPLLLHQPLYPLVMSFFLLFDIHPFTTTTVINVASFCLCILFLGCGSYYFSKSKIFSLIIVFLMTWCPFVIENFDGAMSEPLYMFLTLLNFMAVLLFLEKRKNWMLLLAALAAGLSILTRYIGIVNVVGGALMVFVFLNEKTKNRVITALFYSFLSSVFPIIWLLVSGTFSGIGNRQFIFPQNLFTVLGNFCQAIIIPFADWLPLHKDWLITDEIRFLLVGFLGGFCFISLAIGFWLKSQKKQTPLGGFERLLCGSVILSLTYVLIIFATFAFSSLPPDINNRTLIPLFPFFLMVFYGIFFLFPRTHLEKTISGLSILGIFLVSFWVWYPVSRELLYDRHHNGHGYTSKYYQESTILKAARTLPRDIPWISNEPAFLLLNLDKFPYDLNTLYPAITKPDATALGEGETELDRIFSQEEAALIILQPQLENDLRKLIGDQAALQIGKLTSGLEVYDQSFDGMIFFYPDEK